MRKNTSLIFFIMPWILLSLTGCSSKMTIENLTEKAIESLTAKTSLTSELSLNFSGSNESSESFSGIMTQHMDEDFKTSSSHTSLELQFSDTDPSELLTAQSYVVHESDAVVQYWYEDAHWSRSVIDVENPGNTQTQLIELLTIIGNNTIEATLSETLESIDVYSCYALSTTFTNEIMENLADSNIEGIFGEMANLDNAVFSIPTTFYIDKDTFLIRKISINMDMFCSQLFEQIYDTANFEISAAQCDILFLTYDTITENDLLVPDDIKSAAAEYDTVHSKFTGELTQDDDGNYIIYNEDGTQWAKIKPLENYDLISGNGHQLTFGDDSADFNYFITDGMTVADLSVYHTDTTYLESLGNIDYIRQDVARFKQIGDKKVNYTYTAYSRSGQWTGYYTMWTALDDDTFITIKIQLNDPDNVLYVNFWDPVMDTALSSLL